MVSREWKPGDVAVAYDADWEFRVVRCSGQRDYWSAAGGTWPKGVNGDALNYRPLVVIDPEDRAAVEALRDEFDRHVILQNDDPDPRDLTPGHRGNALQAALRSLIANPEPPEPLADGALVECDYDGKHGRAVLLGGSWTFYGDCLRDGGAIYDDFAAVRVLSEGVTP